MKVLALEAYHGGSHAAFLEDWISRSRHEFELLTLPAHKWKWRMRHGAVTFAEQIQELRGSFDVIFTSDMTNVAELRGLAGKRLLGVPIICYFHENQLTYPNRDPKERDLHMAFSNIVSAIAADSNWFNSAFHLEEFFEAAIDWMKRMPDFAPFDAIDSARRHSIVLHPGVEIPDASKSKSEGPLHICWAARWEHDKNPELFFTALEGLLTRNLPFEVSVLGQQFETSPAVFDRARSRLGDRIINWGYQEKREDYFNALSRADLIVSTADHEFFGLSVLEAMARGCVPILPRRLSYPELLATSPELSGVCFYDGECESLEEKLQSAIEWKLGREIIASLSREATKTASRFAWGDRVREMDIEIERMAAS